MMDGYFATAAIESALMDGLVPKSGEGAASYTFFIPMTDLEPARMYLQMMLVVVLGAPLGVANDFVEIADFERYESALDEDNPFARWGKEGRAE